MKGHNVLICPCKDCKKRRQAWQAKRIATIKANVLSGIRAQSSVVVPPEVWANRRKTQPAPDDVITVVEKRGTRRTQLAPLKGF
jgi:hypothetical protein